MATSRLSSNDFSNPQGRGKLVQEFRKFKNLGMGGGGGGQNCSVKEKELLLFKLLRCARNQGFEKSGLHCNFTFLLVLMSVLHSENIRFLSAF